MYMAISLHACLSIMFMSGAHGAQKGASDLLHLGLQIVSRHVGAGNPGPFLDQGVLLTANPSISVSLDLYFSI